MAALVCDLCGGKLIMGAGGIATCDSCGMEHSADRMKEKVLEIKGVVRVDNTHMVDNYLEMANSAYKADNNSEAESYCNRIIEIDPTNYKAWMLKGKAAAWQSTLQNSRVDEGVAAFIKAINNAPEDEKEDYIEEAKDQIKALAVAMIQLRANRFAKWPDEEESNGFIADITSILSTVVSFLRQAGVLIPISEIMAPIATKINESVVKAWKDVVWPEYNGDPNDSDDRANKYEWQKFIKRVGYCTTLVEKAISLCSEDDEDDIQRYENLIFMHEKAIASCSWDYNLGTYGTKYWHKDWQLTNEAKNYRRGLIREYEGKIKAIKEETARKEAAEKAEKERIAREAAQKRLDAYWLEHAEEKAALETELGNLKSQIEAINAALNNQLAALKEEIAAIPGKSEISTLDGRIIKLTAERNSLGIFKGKEKKAIQEQIDRAVADKEAICSRMAAAKKPLDDQIATAQAEANKKLQPLRDRTNAINSELTKAR